MPVRVKLSNCWSLKCFTEHDNTMVLLMNVDILSPNMSNMFRRLHVPPTVALIGLFMHFQP